MHTTLALINGLVRTMDPARGEAQAVACAGPRIAAVGGVQNALDSRTRILDLGGRTVVPGFIDAHAHLAMLGERALALDLSTARSFDEMVERAAVSPPREGWIIGHGWDLRGALTHDRLSARTPDAAVWLLRKDAHSGLANARALALAGIDEHTPDPPGGRIARDALGRPTGMLFEAAMDLIDRRAPRADLIACLEAGQAAALRSGVTCVHDACVDAALAAAYRRASLRLRVYGMYWDRDQESLAGFARETEPEQGERFTLRAIKLFVDGSLGSGTAWMLDGRGVGRLTARKIREVARSKWQVCCHAIGTRANREVVEAYAGLPEGARARVEHAQHVDPDDIPGFRGLIASMQPSHGIADREMIETLLTDRERRGSYAFEVLARAGARVVFGSDAPVERIDPRWTFDCAVRQGVEPHDALRAMTADAAYAGFMEEEIGMIRPGLRADLAVLEDDWVGHRRASRVLMTIVDGEVAWVDPDWTSIGTEE
ncbi:MAG: amidohydrolase [Planctomycetes bacterium]|nr:amidohydrolase [Planctomycetota bacterium]